MNGTLYGLCILPSMVVARWAFLWLADRLEFSTRWGAILGRMISSAAIGLIIGFILSGLFSEFLNLRSSVSSNELLTSSPQKLMSSFAAAFFGGIFGCIWGVVWGARRGLLDSYKLKSEGGRSSGTVKHEARWLFPTVFLGVAIYFLGLSFQTQPENIFGQFCQRAISTSERLGGTCFRSEWAAVGVILSIVSIVLALRLKATGTAMLLNERKLDK